MSLERELRAQTELRDWATARSYRDRAAEYLEIAHDASDPEVQNRYRAIAQHYCALAQRVERLATRRGDERRARTAFDLAHGHVSVGLPKT